ncbi:hypothetical protein HCEG_02242 [Histoplasma capsulatum var. duboisii H88]|uniref:Uncharacterized protein n=2 Tax=Ajellomyces capsulatus TaxID=5037 RepID=F0UBB8_AJEC8|nr:hypothetical protein HCDG_02392 [Histoplasma capsulatum H143]EGC43027.1 hypothetical protein HCEG_02242 [Histoplasma capsulatum var. duboisii H88]
MTANCLAKKDLRKRKKKGDIWFRDGVHEHSLSLTLATRNGYATRPVWLRLRNCFSFLETF